MREIFSVSSLTSHLRLLISPTSSLKSLAIISQIPCNLHSHSHLARVSLTSFLVSHSIFLTSNPHLLSYLTLTFSLISRSHLFSHISLTPFLSSHSRFSLISHFHLFSHVSLTPFLTYLAHFFSHVSFTPFLTCLVHTFSHIFSRSAFTCCTSVCPYCLSWV